MPIDPRDPFGDRRPASPAPEPRCSTCGEPRTGTERGSICSDAFHISPEPPGAESFCGAHRDDFRVRCYRPAGHHGVCVWSPELPEYAAEWLLELRRLRSMLRVPKNEALFDFVMRLFAERDALAADAKRIDWLDQRLQRWGHSLQISPLMLTWFPDGWHVAANAVSDPVIDEATFRVAIDAAMQRAERGTTEPKP